MADLLDAQGVTQRLRRIRLLLLDIDGVLTDGRVIYGDYGDELKFFDSQDGLGIELLHRAGIRTVILSGRKSRVNRRRVKDLKIAGLLQGLKDKRNAYDWLLRKFRVAPAEICCIGDDLKDLPLLQRSGFAVAVQNAVPEVRRAAHYVTKRPGGRGAVREVADQILKSQGKWRSVTEPFFS